MTDIKLNKEAEMEYHKIIYNIIKTKKLQLYKTPMIAAKPAMLFVYVR